MSSMDDGAAIPKMDDSISIGGKVKGKGEVIKQQFDVFKRPPNMNCRIETYSRICQTFDERRIRWVNEMGLGGLLSAPSDIHLPRQFGYWLMSRIDPLNKLLIAPDGKQFRLSPNQVHWVLGIPNGGLTVPTGKLLSVDLQEKVNQIQHKYGQASITNSWNYVGCVYTSVGIPVNSKVMERLEGGWEANEEEEFKTLFLLISLEMVLCPTQSPRLACDLVPALTCTMNVASYNWCELVLNKLMGNVASFARRFYSNGVAGGCTIFGVLNRFPVDWGQFPRIRVWNMTNISIASKEDRFSSGSDYGATLDVAYGELHPKEARDTDGPPCVKQQTLYEFVQTTLPCHKAKRRRGAPPKEFPQQPKNAKGNASSNGCSGSTLPLSLFDNPSLETKRCPCSDNPELGNIMHCASHCEVGSGLNWCMSSKRVKTLERLVGWFRRLYMIQMSETNWNPLKMDGSIKTEEVFFGGVIDGLELLLRCLNRFLDCELTQFMALVSEMYSEGMEEGPLSSNFWLVAKVGKPIEVCLLQLGHGDPVLHYINSMNSIRSQVVAVIYEHWFKHLPFHCVTRNVILCPK